MYCLSGSGAESVISQSASVSSLFCAGTSRELRLFRRIISAELMPMRVNQVEKVDLPSKLWRWRNALKKASWTASSASSWLRVMRRTVQKSFCACARYHVSSAPVSPLLAVAAPFMPHIRFLALYRCSPMFVFRSTASLLTLSGPCLRPTSFLQHPFADVRRTVQH
jgi:hypothetical protein